VIVPQHYDQPYWAQRVGALGLGAAHAPGTPTVTSLAAALERALHAEVAARAFATTIRDHGARVAAAVLAALR
jgi:vancomycin aglycone glucosyltransferase